MADDNQGHGDIRGTSAGKAAAEEPKKTTRAKAKTNSAGDANSHGTNGTTRVSSSNSGSRAENNAEPFKGDKVVQSGSTGSGSDTMKKVDKVSQSTLEPMAVSVETNLDKAMKILKRKLIKEGFFKELKTRRYYEKPSEKRKRKMKETIKKLRKEEIRARKNTLM